MEQYSSLFGGVINSICILSFIWTCGPVLLLKFYAFHWTAIPVIQQRLCGANRDTLVLEMHQLDEALDRPGPVLASQLTDLR